MFVVLTTQRSGSTYLVRALNSHPDITCYGELFISRETHRHVGGDRRFFHYLDESYTRRLLHPFRRRHDIDAFLREMLVARGAGRVAGFKLMYDQLEWHLRAWITDNPVSIIHLVRGNCFSSLLSREVARHSGVAHTSTGVDIRPFSIDIRRFLPMLEDISTNIRNYRVMLEKFPSVCEVTYERFFADPEAESARILSFLGVDPHVSLICDLKKISPSCPEKIIANYEELISALRQRGHAHLLEQD